MSKHIYNVSAIKEKMKITNGGYRLRLWFRTKHEGLLTQDELQHVENIVTEEYGKFKKEIKEAKRKEAAGGTHTGNTTV